MNIIITLPIDLIAEIAEGRKLVEIRKSCPTLFNPDGDIVWVKTKGADKVPMCFEIDHFEKSNDFEDVWKRYRSQMGINQAWWKKYTQNAIEVVIWHIKNVQVFQPNLSFSETFPNLPAPQSYIYTAKGIIQTKHRNVKKREAKEGAEGWRMAPPKTAVQ